MNLYGEFQGHTYLTQFLTDDFKIASYMPKRQTSENQIIVNR
jgi:hypothetical protein